jgi:hypothetical protein
MGTKGAPKTGGRSKGTPNRATAATAAAIAASGLTPLDYMLEVMRDESADLERRLEAARAAAPYVHSRLSSVQLTGANGGPIDVNCLSDDELARIAVGGMQ